jgi:transposase InsO family protein
VGVEVEARICELRRQHPRWGPRRLEHELARELEGDLDRVPSRATIYRVLVRNNLLQPRKRRRRHKDYKRWERSAPMQLWQLDITGEVMLADGREAKLVTGVDAHSRYCVTAKVTEQATGRAVCRAFVAAMRRYGVPEEVLTSTLTAQRPPAWQPRPAGTRSARGVGTGASAAGVPTPRPDGGRGAPPVRSDSGLVLTSLGIQLLEPSVVVR